MPSMSQHLAQAAENHAFLSSAFTPTDAPRWRVIVCFYVAVHYMDAFLDRVASCHPDKHTVRFGALQRQMRARRLEPGILIAYRQLYDMSVSARYECVPIDQQMAHRAQQHLLPTIETWVHREIPSDRF